MKSMHVFALPFPSVNKNEIASAKGVKERDIL